MPEAATQRITIVRVQREDFDVGAELSALTRGRTDVGGVASFVGVVRDANEGEGVGAMTLEHYPGMTEKELRRIAAEAHARWPLSGTLILHRVGRLAPGERIVLCAAASSHRHAAFEACAFLIDFLKTQAPFWKREETGAGERWVEARGSDDDAARRWDR
jgi:molybdopterin synthase catalytic subunit